MHNMSSGDDDDGQKNVAVKWVDVGGRRTSFAILMRHFVVHLRRHIRFNSPARSLSTQPLPLITALRVGGLLVAFSVEALQ